MKVVLSLIFAALLVGLPLVSFGGPTTDTDGDGIPDSLDNCSANANATQTDTDGDVCGNRCDPDYDQNGTVGASDFSIFKLAFLTSDPNVELDDPPNGTVGASDFSIFKSFFLGPPGPSGPTPGTTACP